MPLSISLVTPDGHSACDLTVPTSWADVSVAQYLRLLTEPDLPRICILTDLEEDLLNRLAAQDATYLQVVCLDFLHHEEELAELKPTEGLADIGSSSYGQLLLVQQFMQANPDQIMMVYAPWILAVYESERQLKTFNSNARMQQLYEDTLAAPLPKVYADLVAFLQAWSNFMNATTKPMMTTSPTMTSSTPAWKKYSSALGRFWSSIRSRKATRFATKRS